MTQRGHKRGFAELAGLGGRGLPLREGNARSIVRDCRREGHALCACRPRRLVKNASGGAMRGSSAGTTMLSEPI